PGGEVRESFNPGLRGDQVERLERLPGGDVLVLGALDGGNEIRAGTLLKLKMLEQNHPPAIQFLTPTNGAVFHVSDAIPQFQLSVRAYDPDGFVETLSAALDGTNLVATPSGVIEYLDHPPGI